MKALDVLLQKYDLEKVHEYERNKMCVLIYNHSIVKQLNATTFHSVLLYEYHVRAKSLEMKLDLSGRIYLRIRRNNGLFS